MTDTANNPTLDDMINDAHRILDDAWWQHVGKPDKKLSGVVVLFSGGNDSTVLAHLMRDRASHFAHANTTIGIEQTRQFVRDVSRTWGVELIEETATGDDTYEALVLDQGFPGPGHHFKMYQRLKERQLRKVQRQLITNGRDERVIFLAGRRRAESDRRSQRFAAGELVEHERQGSVVWCSPLLHWTASDMAAYRERFDVPRNEVSDMIHMSGECLCGAFAKPNELDEIGFFFPEVKAEIEELQVKVRARGTIKPERCVWGWGADMPITNKHRTGPLCDACDVRRYQLTLFDEATL